MPKLSRHDSYGRPLPSLVPAAQDMLLDPPTGLAAHPSNLAQRQRLVTLLNQQIDIMLSSDMTAEVTLTFTVVHGIIQNNSLYLGVGRRYRPEE